MSDYRLGKGTLQSSLSEFLGIGKEVSGLLILAEMNREWVRA